MSVRGISQVIAGWFGRVRPWGRREEQAAWPPVAYSLTPAGKAAVGDRVSPLPPRRFVLRTVNRPHAYVVGRVPGHIGEVVWRPLQSFTMASAEELRSRIPMGGDRFDIVEISSHLVRTPWAVVEIADERVKWLNHVDGFGNGDLDLGVPAGAAVAGPSMPRPPVAPAEPGPCPNIDKPRRFESPPVVETTDPNNGVKGMPRRDSKGRFLRRSGGDADVSY